MTEKMKSIRTPYAYARGLGSAKDGAKHWWMMRIAAVPMIPLFIYFLTQINHLCARDRAEFANWVAQPATSVALIVFILCSFYHACFGVEEIIIDYVPSQGQKAVALLLNKMFFFGLGVASLYAVLAISFGVA